jgi:hypothetical protein
MVAEAAAMIHLECLLGLEDFGESLASGNTQSVALESGLLDIGAGDEILEVGFNICSSVQLQGLALQRKQFARHGCFGFGPR